MVNYEQSVYSFRIGHHQFLHIHGSPEAWLIRSHSLTTFDKATPPQNALVKVTLIAFCLPMVAECVRAIYVDGVINALDLRVFVNDMGYQINSQMILVCPSYPGVIHSPWPTALPQSRVLMAVNCTILSIPILGTLTVTKTLTTVSFLLGASSLFTGLLALHFSKRMKSITFSVCSQCPSTWLLLYNQHYRSMSWAKVLPWLYSYIAYLEPVASWGEWRIHSSVSLHWEWFKSGILTVLAFAVGILLDPSNSWTTNIACITTFVVILGPLCLSAHATFRTGLVHQDDPYHQ